MAQSPPSLQKSEWIFFVVILALISTVFTISKLTSARSLERLQKWEKKEPLPEVWIELAGHVKRPGKYKLRPGECLGAALRKAGLKPFADLSGIDIALLPDRCMRFDIPEARTIHIRVEGCVKEILELEVDRGSRISDLKGKIEVTADADPKFFRKRRKLREGELVEIPIDPKTVCLR